MCKALFLAFLLLPFLAQSQVTDHEGRTYKTVKIGNQTWMAENLNVTKFRNGEDIPVAESEDDWFLATIGEIPAYVDVEFDSENGKFFGKLYNYYAVSDPRGIAPEGWRVPTDEDWNQLAEALGGPEAATAKLKSSDGWVLENENGTDESGFTGYAIGMMDEEGFFDMLGFAAYFWSSTEDGDFVLNRNLSENKYAFEAAQSKKGNGLSLRLIKIE
ncbi:hypothetical protein D0X99_05195 [Algoriphagus lacus]|uniref:Fibrobacter succinogenes major paralogous domain-containing protein n=1 Tax=Algoriphagus lacus TaxID=2056311 RepID=A0A418PUB9_9BACT|nr:fibrobacter succinogenes major paralogous domain-containing protein [Algoriphagus lacus]RIW17150.1 hypothetical protein D0X99_05195 [Algoriphagus lacus]